jgi:hypothetical protein
MAILKAPWTEDQVEWLENWQENDNYHPYTCVCGYSLQPSSKGWYCEYCDYKQNWCHDFSAMNHVQPDYKAIGDLK